MRNSQLFEDDLYAWANEQSALLRAGRLSPLEVIASAYAGTVLVAARETGLGLPVVVRADDRQ